MCMDIYLVRITQLQYLDSAKTIGLKINVAIVTKNSLAPKLSEK